MEYFIISIQCVSFFLIFWAISGFYFSKLELVMYCLAFAIFGVQIFSYLGLWTGAAFFVAMVLISAVKEGEFSFLGIFYAVYAVFLNSLLSGINTNILHTLAQMKLFHPFLSVEMITLLAPIFTPIINYLIILFLSKRYPHFINDILRKSNTSVQAPVILFLIIIISVLYVCNYLDAQFGFNAPSLNIIFSSIFILFIASLVYMNYRYKLVQQKETDKIKLDQLDQLIEYTTQLEKFYEEIREFRHDYINILVSLEEGIYQNNLEKVKSVYENTIKPSGQIMRSNEVSVVKLRNMFVSEVKSILASKILIAQQKDIEVTLEIEDPVKVINMDLISFTRIISIFLDNAIEAAVHSDIPKVVIAFIQDKPVQIIKIENSCKDDVNIREISRKGYTTKGKNHGFGLSNVDKIVDQNKYATIDTAYHNKWFSQTLTLKEEPEN